MIKSYEDRAEIFKNCIIKTMNDMTSKIFKATNDEKSSYNGIYSLYGFIYVDGYRCIIEDKRPLYSQDEAYLDVLAPKGMLFLCTGTISLCCDSPSDVVERTEDMGLVAIDYEKNPELDDRELAR